MEEIITQKFTYATITLFKDYCKFSDKKKSINSIGVNLDIFDGDEEEIGLRRINSLSNLVDNLKKPKVGRVVEFPQKMGNRKTKFFYDNSDISERTNLNYAIYNFETRNDRHIKKHYGNPFAEITIKTIERSIRRHGDKVTIKVYRNIKQRSFNNIYFKKFMNVESVTFNTVTGNITTLTMGKNGKKLTKTFRTNNFFMLEQQFKDGGILNMRKSLDDNSVLIDEYNKTFNNSEFIFKIDETFKLNQNVIFNGVRFLQLMLDRFVGLKKIKVSNNYELWIKKCYPTEKFLKKNERKLVASILDMFQIKSKITIKIMHQNSKLDISSLCRLCYFFGDNFSKYIGSINNIHFLKSSFEDHFDLAYNKLNFANEFKKDSFQITNVEKENIVKIINSLDTGVGGHQRIVSKNDTLVNPHFMGELEDHFKMIKRLRQFIPDLHLKSKNITDFRNEHIELSNMISQIKKGWVLQYFYPEQTVKDIQQPVCCEIKTEMWKNDGNGNSELLSTVIEGSVMIYPQILTREEEYHEEGKFMHHCVASYVETDTSMIVSLRTEDKQDRVTCEFKISDGRLIQSKHFSNAQPPKYFEKAIENVSDIIKLHSRFGTLNWTKKDRVPVKINGVEIKPDQREPRRLGDVLDGVWDHRPQLF